MRRRATAWLALGLIFAALLSLFWPWQALAALPDDLARAILIELRLPRTLLALLIGATLAATGAALQGLFANPLASPDIVGASGGAALGAILVGYGLGLMAPLAFMAGGMAGAGAALWLLLLLGGRGSTATLLLAGIAITALTGALSTLALALAPSPFAFYDIHSWLMGSLVDRSLDQLMWSAPPMAAAVLLAARAAPALDALTLGEDVAAAMGHRPRDLRRRLIVASGLGIGAAVSVSGAIGFIGLVAPVLARGLTGGLPGRAVVPAAMIGAILLALADLAVRFAPAGRVLPVGVVTALVGVPFFLWLVARRHAGDRP